MSKPKQRSKRNWEHGHRSRAAVKAAHPDLDPDATIHYADLDTFKALGFINLPAAEFVQCRLERGGKVCQTEHGRGIVVESRGDTVSYVGWCCYDNWLDSHVGFKEAVVRLDREFKAADLARRLGVYLNDQAFVNRAEALRDRCSLLELRLSLVKGAIPQTILRRLDEIRQGVSHVLAIKAYRRRRDRDGNLVLDEDQRPITETERIVVGQLAGLRALDHVRLREIVEPSKAITLALEKAREKAAPSSRNVDRWVQEFDRLPAIERNAERLEADLDAFMATVNLELLRFVGHYVGQPSLAFKAIAKLRRQPDLSQAAAEREAQDWSAALCSFHKCDRFDSHGV